MLFLAKQHARTAVLVMLGLLVVSNAWAGVRGIALNDALTPDLASVVFIALGLTLSASIDSVIFLASWIIGFHPFLDSFKTGYSRLFGHVSLAAIFAGGLLAALGEETFFRGILQREWGILPAAVLFALAHVGRGLKLFTVWALLEGLGVWLALSTDGQPARAHDRAWRSRRRRDVLWALSVWPLHTAGRDAVRLAAHATAPGCV